MVKKDLKEVKAGVLKSDLGNSIQPSISEIERFICFQNKRFGMKLPDNLIVNIEETRTTTKGFFMSDIHDKHYENTKQPLNYICISSNHLKDKPYEVVSHELGHFYNYVNGIKDCTTNQYHNKHFKEIAERLLLKVEKGKRGFAYTSATPEYQKMLKEFKPDKQAFHVFQNQKDSEKKSPNRNLLYMCECGIKVRTAYKPFQALCQECNTEFKAQ